MFLTFNIKRAVSKTIISQTRNTSLVKVNRPN